MKAQFTRRMQVKDPRSGLYIWQPAGYVHDHPEAYLTVQMGFAIPADEECEQAAGLTAEQIEAAHYAYERTSRAIHPEDFDLYDAGLMDGYDGQGKPTLNGQPSDMDRIHAFRSGSELIPGADGAGSQAGREQIAARLHQQIERAKLRSVPGAGVVAAGADDRDTIDDGAAAE